MLLIITDAVCREGIEPRQERYRWIERMFSKCFRNLNVLENEILIVTSIMQLKTSLPCITAEAEAITALPR